MNNFIFSKLCELKERWCGHYIASTSIEVKYINTISNLYFSILLDDGSANDIEHDEIVIEINSKDGFYFNADLSDSSGYIYIERPNISNRDEIISFFQEAEEQLPFIFSRLLKK
ncbi:hypothetical protein [uncultured Pluralibacter sp.]|uniref:hypothetical protein n=1 Tax=uncultured Pluralibacter sp. TaxID=1490864 RepID=UPI002604FA86|nr:hypothetical protein [uncultured Pluralibacter sp.]